MEPLKFSYSDADDLKQRCTDAAAELDGQRSGRRAAATSALEDFAGYYSRLFKQNSENMVTDGDNLAIALREVASMVGQLADSARREDERRKRAREWHERQANRNLLEKAWDGIFGGEDPPSDPPEPQLHLSSNAQLKQGRQTGGRGPSGGRSSAIPEKLRLFAQKIPPLDEAFDSIVKRAKASYDAFVSACDWGSLSADGVFSAADTWQSDNDNDVKWITVVADLFARAGSEGTWNVIADQTISNALQAAGVRQVRQPLNIELPQAHGGVPTTGYSNDPINTATGNFLEPETDFAFAGAASALQVTRMYNSLDTTEGLFGQGWSSLLETRLEFTDEQARWTMPDGRLILFPRAGEEWERSTAENFRLTREPAERLGWDRAGEVWVIRDLEGQWYAFTGSGAWAGSGCGYGNTVTVERDDTGLITRLSHERNRSIDIEYRDGKPVVLRGSDGRRTEYRYDEHGRVLSVTTANGTRSYRYNDRGWIERVVTEDGTVALENVYDEQGRVTSQRTPFGRNARYLYLPGFITAVSDADASNTNTWVHDPHGRLIGVVDTDDNRLSLSYDAYGNLVTATERDGEITAHAYDERGRRIRTVTPEGADLTWGYDDQDRITTMVNASGGVISYEYADDIDRNPCVIIDPEGGRSEFEWENGLLVRTVDPSGVELRFRYDEHGNQIAVINAAGDTARFEYDASGFPIAAIDPLGNRSRFRYDAAGNLTRVERPNGAVWRYSYGPGGRLLSVTSPLGAEQRFEYGVHGEIERVIDPLGNVTTRAFDSFGNIESVTGPNRARWDYRYNGQSQLTGVVDPRGGEWQLSYDVNGQLETFTDPTGVRERFETTRTRGGSTVAAALAGVTDEYDELGRLRRSIAAAEPGDAPSTAAAKPGDAPSAEQLFSYDMCGRPVEIVNGDGGLTKLVRDAAGKVITAVSPEGLEFRYEYDRCGRLVAEIDPDGLAQRYEYDAMSRVVKCVTAQGETLENEYDPVGNIVRQTSSVSGTTRYRYDKENRLVAQQGPRFGRVSYRYDLNGNLIEQINGLGGRTRYEYDSAGNLVTVTDPAGGVIRQEHDELGNLTSVTDQLGRVSRREYDAASRLLRETSADGSTTENHYSVTGLLQAISVDGVTQIEWQHGARAITLTDHTGSRYATHRLEYNPQGQLLRRLSEGPEGSDDRLETSWSVNRDGQRTGFRSANGDEVRYERDSFGRTVAVTHSGVGGAEIRYGADGEVERVTRADSRDEWERRGGRVTAHTRTFADGSARRTDVVRDDYGDIAKLVVTRIPAAENEPSTVTEIEFEYDAARQLTRAGDNRWEYNPSGQLVDETVDGVRRRFTYDLAGQLETETIIDPAGGMATVRYEYDSLGRRVAQVSDTERVEFTWDPIGRVSRVTTTVFETETAPETSSTITLVTNALGELERVNDTRLVWDVSQNRYLLAEVNGEACASLFGDFLGQPGFARSGAAAPLTASTGSTVSAASADSAAEAPEIGWRVARSTPAGNPWGIAEVRPEAGLGVTRDGTVTVAGLEWLGARMYDERTRAFLSMDPLDDVLGATWASNPYSYAGNNPLGLLDPLGLRPVTEEELQAYRDSNQGALAKGVNWMKNNWEYVAGGAMVAVGVGLMFTGVGGPAGVALIAGSGALTAGGISVVSQKAQYGTVDVKQVGGAMLVGGVTAFAGGGATAIARHIAGNMRDQFIKAAAVHVGINGGVGAATNGGMYVIQNGGVKNPWELAGAMAGGFVSSGFGAMGKPVSNQVQRLTGLTGKYKGKAIEAAVSASTAYTGSTTDDIIAGREVNHGRAAEKAGLSAAGKFLPQPGKPDPVRNQHSFRQMAYFGPKTPGQVVMPGVTAQEMYKNAFYSQAHGKIRDGIWEIGKWLCD